MWIIFPADTGTWVFQGFKYMQKALAHVFARIYFGGREKVFFPFSAGKTPEPFPRRRNGRKSAFRKKRSSLVPGALTLFRGRRKTFSAAPEKKPAQKAVPMLFFGGPVLVNIFGISSIAGIPCCSAKNQINYSAHLCFPPLCAIFHRNKKKTPGRCSRTGQTAVPRLDYL